jgi:hypothetical protein
LTESTIETYPNLFFVTHPRSGLNYFAEYFFQVTGYNLARSHNLEDYKKGVLVTIVRNPVDTLASHVSMMCKTSNFKNLSVISKLAEESAKNYEDFYKNVIPKTNIIISYESFIENPKEIMSDFLNKLKIKHTMCEYNQTLRDRDGEYLVSSSKTELYDILKMHYHQYNLKNHFDLFGDALSRH